ncbi:hypothetical protein EES47_24810 [Streptomyces sp. ADI98-12]|nr:hypothetical protein EES47_24810 [Streptomyces sp. ADI98-12]
MTSVWPTSAGCGAVPVVTWAARLAACSRRAAGAAAERTQGRVPPAGRVAAAAGAGSSAGVACSRTACALVPLMPKEETAARSGRPALAHSVFSVIRRTVPLDQSMWLEGSAACRVRGRVPWRIAMTILMTPATPAADWVWPMLDFTEPSSSGSPGSRSLP